MFKFKREISRIQKNDMREKKTMDFTQHPFLVPYCCKDGELLNEALWSVKYKVRKI